MMEDRLSILRDIESPPHGWRYTVAETGVEVRAPYAESLKNQIQAHMVANSIPIPWDYDEWIEDEICRANKHGSPWCGRRRVQPAVEISQHINLATARRFVMTIIHALRDRQFVPRAEAFRRAEICRACPMAGGISGCKGCGSILKSAERLLLNSPIKFPEDKSFCLACGCYLKAKILLPNETLNKAEPVKPEYHKNCWRHDEP